MHQQSSIPLRPDSGGNKSALYENKELIDFGDYYEGMKKVVDR
jgi:Ca2+-binding EF-hand superfamily protein